MLCVYSKIHLTVMKAFCPLCLTILLSCLVLTSTTAAQNNLYEPRTEPPDGTELVAVYLGAEWCAPCHLPENIQAVEDMKMAFREIADDHGWSFKVVGVAVDWSIEDGYEFLRKNGDFDEVILGNNWTNLGAATYIWKAEDVWAAVPQIVVYKQDVIQTGSGIEFSDRYNVKRFQMEELRNWLESGASWDALSAKYQ